MVRFACTLAALSILLVARTSQACDCDVPGFEEQMKTAAAVFTGKALKVEAAENHQVLVTFEVKEAWKGAAEREIKILTAEDGAACGYEFEPGQSYLVYAVLESETLTTNICTRTRSIKDAAEDLEQLGKPELAPA